MGGGEGVAGPLPDPPALREGEVAPLSLPAVEGEAQLDATAEEVGGGDALPPVLPLSFAEAALEGVPLTDASLLLEGGAVAAVLPLAQPLADDKGEGEREAPTEREGLREGGGDMDAEGAIEGDEGSVARDETLPLLDGAFDELAPADAVASDPDGEAEAAPDAVCAWESLPAALALAATVAPGVALALVDTDAEKVGESDAAPLCEGVPAAEGGGDIEAVPFPDGVCAADEDASALPEAEGDAETLREAAAEALAQYDCAALTLFTEDAEGEGLESAVGVSGPEGAAVAVGHEALLLRLGEPVDDGVPFTEAERGGERDADGELLSAAEIVAKLADAEADCCALVLARPLRENEGELESTALPVISASVPVCVTDLDARGDAE